MINTKDSLSKTVAASVQLYLDITGDTPEQFQVSLKDMAADAARDRFNEIMQEESIVASQQTSKNSQ
jgi:hypothetical protein